MNRTLLVEERDEGDNRQDKKKKEKEKFPDTTEKKKKMAFKKADGKKEVHHTNSLTSSSKVQPAEDMADMAAVNPNTEGITSPVIMPPRPVMLQQIPNQNLQQRGNWPQQQYQMAGYPVQNQQPQVQLHGQVPSAQFMPTPFQSPGQPPQQTHGQFVAQSYQQGHSPMPQYTQAGGMPVYSNRAHVLTRTQSLPDSASNAVEQIQSSGQSGWVAQPPASPPPVNSGESSWASHPVAEPREERTWREGENPANNKSGVSNAQWTAFSPAESPAAEEPPNIWANELDEEHSSSDEDVGRSSSPELAGEEGEVLLRAPSLASFAESISSIEDESEDNLWRILPEQREYYTKQFRRLQPIEGGVVQGPRARDFFMKSSLPVEVLSKIWHLSDINKDNALNLDEFCIAMHLVVALRHGFELPSTLPAVLLPEKKETAGSDTACPLEMPQRAEDEEEQEEEEVEVEVESRNVSSPDHWLRFSDSLGRNAASSPTKINNSAVKRKAHSVVQPVPQMSDLQGDEEHAARPRSLSDPTSLDNPASGQANKETNPTSPVRPLHISMPPSQSHQTEVPQTGPTSPSQAAMAEIEIARPRATVKPSLLDVLPGQLLPPPSGKQARDGWTPTRLLASPPSSPEDDMPTSPLSLEGRKTPSTPPPETEEVEGEERPKEDPSKGVVFRANRRSGERPRSTGDVKRSNQNDPSSPSTPADDESQSSASSEGRREPPPPPPRNKKGHSRSSSLDLNKLFATKAKENRGTPPSSSSSYSSQTGDKIPPVKSEPSTPRNRNENSSSSSEAVDENGKAQKQEDFADFSRFESFVDAQETVNRDNGKKDSPQPKLHRRSFSLDNSHEVAWSQSPQKTATEVPTTPSRPPHNQEALPRPVPKLKPPSPPTLKQGRRVDKDGEKERKLKTEPPKVVVRPLTKEDKLNSRVSDLKEKNAVLSKVNSELQDELKTVMERRAALELKLEGLKSPSS